jgi:hypothetical protein
LHRTRLADLKSFFGAKSLAFSLSLRGRAGDFNKGQQARDDVKFIQLATDAA